MKTVMYVFIGIMVFFMPVHTIRAEEKKSMCKCQDCKCTKEMDCGCCSEKQCQCGKGQACHSPCCHVKKPNVNTSSDRPEFQVI